MPYRAALLFLRRLSLPLRRPTPGCFPTGYVGDETVSATLQVDIGQKPSTQFQAEGFCVLYWISRRVIQWETPDLPGSACSTAFCHIC